MMRNKYLLQLAIAFDQFLNALCNGWADETLSSRAHRMRAKGQRYWGWTANFIDKLFFLQKDHCKKSYEDEQLRNQLPPEFR